IERRRRATFMRRIAGLFLTWAILVVVGGCLDSSRRDDIQSSQTGQRILAIKAAGDAKDRSAVPALVDRLDDEGAAVRFFAILALERITGTRMGYDFGAPADRRVAAVERWRRAVNDGEFARLTTQPARNEHSAAVETVRTEASR